MLPAANLHLSRLYDTTVEFFALRSPSVSRGQSPISPERESRSLTPVPDPVAKLTRECASLREKLDAAVRSRNNACPSHQTLESTLPSMRRELDDTKKELARTKLEVARVEERCRALERTLRETREVLKARDAELQRLRGGEQAPGTPQRRQSSDSDHEDVVEYGDETVSHERYEEGLGSSPLEEEMAQKSSAEVFMTKTDAWSGAQVLQAVHDLNSEILQFSATATELCKFQRNSASSPKFTQAMRDTAQRLGQNVANILSTRDHSQDPILVQLALQGCINACIDKTLQNFAIGLPSKHDGILAQIYSHIYVASKQPLLEPGSSLIKLESDPQPTSSRWRALTHRHIHVMYPYLTDYAVNDLAESIYRWSSDLFIVAGCNTSDKACSVSREGLRARFGDQVRRIARTVSKLARLTREEIMSTNFNITAVGHGDKFDPRRMCDSFGDYGRSRGAILVTAELGLRCTTRRKAKDSIKEEDGEIETRLLLQPKVVLDSVLDFIDPK